MLVVRLLRGAVRHAGRGPLCSAEGLSPAACGISSSPRRAFADGRAQNSNCTETDHPKILITGVLCSASVCRIHVISLFVCFFFIWNASLLSTYYSIAPLSSKPPFISSSSQSKWHLILMALDFPFLVFPPRRAWSAGGRACQVAEVSDLQWLCFQPLAVFNVGPVAVLFAFSSQVCLKRRKDTAGVTSDTITAP